MLNNSPPVIDLIIPGLLNLPVYELEPEHLTASMPALHKILRYADRVHNTSTSVDDILIERLGLRQQALPYAHAIRTGNIPNQIVFKPVHLKTDINNAIVFPVDIDEKEINAIIDDLRVFFKEDCEIEALPDNSWLMTLYHCQPITGVPHYWSALGKKVTHYLQQAKTNLAWFKLFNEMQMYLYQHEINQQRELKRLPLVNSLWCWGGDAYQGEKQTNTLWFSDDYEVQKMGELYTGGFSAIHEFSPADIESDVIIVDQSVLKLLKGHSEVDLQQVLQTLESCYFKPLEKFKKHPLIIHTGAAFNFHYRKKSALKFWKKPVKLNDVILQSQSQ